MLYDKALDLGRPSSSPHWEKLALADEMAGLLAEENIFE